MIRSDEPTPADRVYVRNTRDGSRGWLVEKDGKQHVRLDNPALENLREYKPERGDWLIERESRPLTAHQVGKLCYIFDQALCFELGLHHRVKGEWLSMDTDERIDWIANGPPAPEIRRDVWLAIRDSLKDFAK